MPKRTAGRTGSRRTRVKEEVVKKKSRFLESVTSIDVNDVEFMRRFVTDHGKIVPARMTGASAKQQRQIKQGVRRARTMGLLP